MWGVACDVYFIPIYATVDDIFGVVFLFEFCQELSISKILEHSEFGWAAFFVDTFF